MAKKKTSEINKRSNLALGRLPVKTEEDITVLRSCMTEMVKAEEQAKWPRAAQSFENFSFLLGNHYTSFYFTGSGFGYHNSSKPDDNHFDRAIAAIADNRLIAPTENVASMLTSTKPMPRTEENSSDPADENAAELSNIVLKLLFENPMNMPAMQREMALLGAISGTCAIETIYGEGDEPIETYEESIRQEDNPLHDPKDPDSEEKVGRTIHTPKTAYKNDIQTKLFSFYHLIPDPEATSADDLTWIARQTYEDIDSVLERYVRKGDGYLFTDKEAARSRIKDDAAGRSVLFWWHKIQDIIETPQNGDTFAPRMETALRPNQTKLTILDHKPTLEYPRGRTLVMAGGELLFVGDSRSWSEKYPWRWHPYAFWGWFKVPGRFWHMPLLSELVPLQKRINAIDALVLANRHYMSIGHWLLPKHAKVPEGSIGGRPAQHTTYTAIPGLPGPEKVRHTPLPAELLVERQDLINAIDVIAASGLLMDQLAKSSVRSGSMMDILKQEKLRNKSPMLHEFERCLEKVAQNVLIEIQNNLIEEDQELTARIRTAAKGHSALSIQQFTGESLRDHHTVRIDISTELLHTPEARQARALEALQYGAQVMNPNQFNAIWKALDLDEFMEDDANLTIDRVERLLGYIRTNQVQIGDGRDVTELALQGVDNSVVATEVCREEIMKDTFRELPGPVQTAIFGLFDLYRTWAAEEAQQKLMQQIQVQKALGQGSESQ